MNEQRRLLLSYNLQFFAKDGEGGEKTEPATKKKLGDAREEGKVAKSREVNSAATLVTLFLTLKIFVSYMGQKFLSVFEWIYGNLSDFVDAERSGLNVNTVVFLIRGSILIILQILAPFLIAGFIVGLVISIVQVGWKITLKPLMPKFGKFNPISGFKRLISKESLFNLLKAFIKIFVIFYVAYLCIKDKAPLLYAIYDISLYQGLALVGNIIINTGLRISLMYILVGYIDWIYEKHKFAEDMKMTKQEVKDEYKNAEGDPKVKSKQRHRMREAALRRMMSDVPNADVVITNPTHISCAIRYDSTKERAPVLLAKGEDHVAMRIREIAKENNVPIMENKPLARAIYTTVDIGQQIPPELYQAVAEILAVVYSNKAS